METGASSEAIEAARAKLASSRKERRVELGRGRPEEDLVDASDIASWAQQEPQEGQVSGGKLCQKEGVWAVIMSDDISFVL